MAISIGTTLQPLEEAISAESLRDKSKFRKIRSAKAAYVFQEHRLSLAVRSDHQVVETQGKLDDRVEPGEGPVTRPHFFDENAAVARPKQMDHASGQDRLREPVRRLFDGLLLVLNDTNQFARFVQIILGWSHSAPKIAEATIIGKALRFRAHRFNQYCDK
jgi:hypothetical protein